jgi:hypothetical protein
MTAFSEVQAMERVIQSDSTTLYRKSADLILRHVGTYPFGLFKVELKDLIPVMIRE